jgi:hypothetical protein
MPDDPIIYQVPGVGWVPQEVPPVVQQGAQNLATWASAPGYVMEAQQPQVPGQWSDIDEAIRQSNLAAQYQWGPEMAYLMMGLGGAPAEASLAMGRPSIEYLNARRAAKPASGGTTYAREATYAPESALTPEEITEQKVETMWADQRIAQEAYWDKLFEQFGLTRGYDIEDTLGSGSRKLGKLIFAERGGSVFQNQKPGRWPTYTGQNAAGETQEFRDVEQAKQWASPPEVMRPDPAAPYELPPWEEPIKAFHGSPHDFPAFDISKIGTGQGAQTYGHGLYFAEERKVAKDYQTQLALNARQNLSAVEQMMYDTLERANWNRARAKRLFADEHGVDISDPYLDRIDKIEKASPGRMYEVNINADPEHFLDWDKPLSEQPHIAEKLGKAGYNIPGISSDTSYLEKMAAEQGPESWYALQLNSIRNTMNKPGSEFVPKRAEDVDAIRQAGIPGIKYLDQGSRDTKPLAQIKQDIADYEKAIKDPNISSTHRMTLEDRLALHKRDLKNYKEPTHNYVVFDDKLIDIIKKYGVAGLIGAGASNWSPDQAKAGEAGQIEPGNIDIHNRPVVHNPDGTISTVRSISIQDDQGRVILIPTVIGNRVVSNKEAEAEYWRTGQHLGIFSSEKAAKAYAESLHEEQAQEYKGK